ncbi:unnamed protein product [Rotaria magnacalcarata]
MPLPNLYILSPISFSSFTAVSSLSRRITTPELSTSYAIECLTLKFDLIKAKIIRINYLCHNILCFLSQIELLTLMLSFFHHIAIN